MKVLVPLNFTLLSSTVPIDEAPVFTHKIFNIGDKVVYANNIYKRLTGVDTFPIFDPKHIYIEGDTASYNTINYINKLGSYFESPITDTVHWQEAALRSYLPATAYTAGDVILYNMRFYLCITTHTSPAASTALAWVAYQGSSYYIGGICTYSGRTYRLLISYSAGSLYSIINPPSAPGIWQDITDTSMYPNTASTYWQDITDHEHNNKTFYTAGSCVVLDKAIAYKCIVDLAMPTPNSDTSRWQVAQTSLPTNTTDWENLGAANRFKMFDQYLSTYTFSNGNMEVSVTDVDFNALYAGNIFADSVTISVIDNTTAAVVETKTIDLTYDCVDIFDYFFGDWMEYRIPTIKYERTSVYNNVSCQLLFTGAFVRVGIFAIGKAYFIGDEVWEPEIEALDFSTIIEDTATGEVYLKPGNELKVKSIDLWVDTNRMPATDDILGRVRGMPAIYYGNNENLDTYGFIRKKIEILKGPVKSRISIEIRELL